MDLCKVKADGSSAAEYSTDQKVGFAHKDKSNNYIMDLSQVHRGTLLMFRSYC